MVSDDDAPEEIFIHFGAGDDRSEAIVAGALLENCLEFSIKQHLIRNDVLFSSFFKGTGPLATFAAKIDMAVLLGILTEDQADSFNTVRKVRNDFAHNVRPLDFSSQRINALCNNLMRPTEYRLDEATLRLGVSDDTARARYLGAIVFYVAALTWRGHVNGLPDFSELPPSPDKSGQRPPSGLQTGNHTRKKRVSPPPSSPE